MDHSDSFYEYDIGLESTFSNQKPVAVSIYPTENQTNEDSFGFTDIAPYNEESIDLEQYLHLGNTPPEGDELLKQFGAYSASPPIHNRNNPSTFNSSTVLNQGFAKVSLNCSATVDNPNSNSIEQHTIVQANQPSIESTPELGFKIKKEFEERSVPDFEEISMPSGEEQNNMIAKGDQGNHIGCQQTYVMSSTFSQADNVVTTSSQSAEPYNVNNIHTVNLQEAHGQSSPLSPGEVPSGPKKRQRQSPDKESDDYKNKRQRNNMAVRKSREKSKVRNQGLQSKVDSLQSENDRLNKKVELLSKELTVLRSLFTTVKPSSGQ